MKILIVNRFFGGAQIPTGRMAEDVARLLVEAGHEVVALASTGIYAGAEKQAQHGARSMEHGATEQRSEGGSQRSESRGNEHGAPQVETVCVPKWMPRALAWLWFTLQARKRIPRLDWDVCVLMTDPPLLPLLARRIRRKAYGIRHVAVWLMDLYPEALAASGRIGTGNPIYRWYFNKRQQSLAAADLLICLGQTQKELLDAGGTRHTATRAKRRWVARQPNSIQPTRIAVVPPWDDRGNIALATEESLKNLALYAGNLGEAHCFEEILAAAPYLPGDWTIRFAARGAKLAALKAAASGTTGPLDHGTASQEPEAASRTTRHRDNRTTGARVEITGYASEEETPELLASARVHLITMSPGWEGIVVPSKLYGCIRTGRPVLFIGPEDADTAREIRAHDLGAVLPAGASGEEVAAAILELAARETRSVLPQQGAGAVAKLIQTLATD